MENTCICCGEIIPEGRMVCPICEMKAKDLNFGNFSLTNTEKRDIIKDTKNIKEPYND